MNFNSKIFNILLYLIFLIPYTGVAYPSYPIVVIMLILSFYKLRLKEFDIFLIVLILIFSCIKCFFGSISSSLLIIKYIFGFLVFYLLFIQKLDYLKINFNSLLIIVSSVLILEAVLINTVLPAVFWPHFPKDEYGLLLHKGQFFDFYQRPYGIGTNPSVTTTLIICLLFTRDKVQTSNSKLSILASFLSILSIIISLSGTGFFLLFIYLIYHYSNVKKIRWVMLFLIIPISYFLIFFRVGDSILYTGLDKISPDYIQYLIDYKITQWLEESHSFFVNYYNLLFGKIAYAGDIVSLGGDFGILNFFIYGGILSFILYLFIIGNKINQYNFFIFFVLILGSFHYAAIFTTPGQIVFSFCLALNKNRIKIFQNQYRMPILKETAAFEGQL